MTQYKYTVISTPFNETCNIIRDDGKWIFLNEADTRSYCNMRNDYKNSLEDVIEMLGFKEADWKN